MSITAMKQALEALKYIGYVPREDGSHPIEKAFTALRTAIAEAEKVEPVGHLTSDGDFIQNQRWVMEFGIVPRYKSLYLAAGAQPAPKQEPVAYLVYAKGSHKYMTLTFDTDKVPEIYKGGDVVALCAAGAQAKQERTPHLSGNARCLACKHEWVAVAPIGAVWLECPECSLERGRMIAQVQRDCLHWVCGCDNDLFYVTQDGYYCPNCGLPQAGY